ncbi:tetratricopeptide repeat protein [Rickettsia endosymbiont of Orchestes rusci]|uniref:tetratricopeptide repeat protein n=1 Tax=Rickettsia endosymbiont of Orchestes rusci TaxID=3066250 RepID=UPI00313ED8BF
MKNKTAQDYFEKGEVLFAAENLEEIDVFIEECYRQGHAYFERGKEDIKYFHEAAKLFQYVFEFNPEYPDIYYHMGRAFYESNNKYQAYVAFKKLRMLNPNYKDASDNMKQIQEDLGIEENNRQLKRVENHDEGFEEVNFSENSSDYEPVTRAEFNSFKKMTFQAVMALKENADNQQEILDISRKTKKAWVIKNIKLLKNENLELYKYCQTFHYTITNIFQAYITLGTGLIGANIDKFEKIHCKVLRKFACYGTDLMEIVAAGYAALGPGICAIHEFTADIYDLIMGKKFDNRVECINKIIAEKFHFKSVAIELGELALMITNANKEKILNPPLIENKNWLQTKLSYVKQKAFGASSPNKKNSPTESAFEDVTLFMMYLFKNHKSIIDNKLPFKEQVQVILGKNLTNLLIDDTENFKQITFIQSIIPPKDRSEIEKNTLKKIWNIEPSRFNLSWFKPRPVSDFLEEEYIKNSLSCSNSNLAKIAIFDIMINAVVNNNSKNFECLIEFSKKFPHIINYMAYYCPERFGGGEIAEKCIEDAHLRHKVVEELTVVLSDSKVPLLLLENVNEGEDKGLGEEIEFQVLGDI